MSDFVWAKWMLLQQVDSITVASWAVLILAGAASAAMYLNEATSPVPLYRRGTTWVPLPEDLPAGPVGPYGAAVLKSGYRRFMARGFGGSALFHALVIGMALLAAHLGTRETQEGHGVIIEGPIDLVPPPALEPTENRLTGLNYQSESAPPPPNPIPIPVPDATASPYASIPSMKELGDLGPMYDGNGEGNIWGGGGGQDPFGHRFVVAPPEEDTLDPHEFRLVQSMPELVTLPEPEYPPLARIIGLEGVVKVLALVGKDGRVHNVKIEKSIEGLNDAAVSSVRQATFKPALWQNKPVAVWVSVPIRFSLRQP